MKKCAHSQRCINVVVGMFEIKTFLGNFALAMSSVLQFYFVLRNATVINIKYITIHDLYV